MTVYGPTLTRSPLWRRAYSKYHEGPSTQQAIAARLDVSARNITGLVDALEQSSLVARTAHPTDRRAHLVSLTSIGTDLMVTTAEQHADLSAVLLDAVAPADREALERGLDQVAARIVELMDREAEKDAP